jgi:hypothetical protein
MTAQASPFRSIGDSLPSDAPSEGSPQSLEIAAGVVAFLGLVVLLSAGLGVGVPIGMAVHLLPIASIGAGGSMVMVARGLDDSERGPWMTIGSGIVVAGVGQAFKALLAPLLPAVQNAPDFFSIAAVVVLSAGLFRLPQVRSTRIAALRIALDVLVAMTAASTVLWAVVPGVFDTGFAAPMLHALLFGSMFVAFL